MNVSNIKSLNESDKDWLIEECLSRFGSMNKNDYEVALFTLLLRNGYSEMSDFDISRELKITETKVKRLRYESNLVYPNNTDLRNQLRVLLDKVKFRISDSNKIQFLIKDKNLRLYANDIFEAQGGFADSSFNSSIVSVTPEDLVSLLTVVFDGDKEKINITIHQVRNKLQDSSRKLPQTLKGKIFSGIDSLLRGILIA